MFKIFKENNVDRRIEALLKSQEELKEAQERSYRELEIMALKQAQKTEDDRQIL